MPQWTTGQAPLGQSLELREHGIVSAVGGELSIPFGTRFGVRGEVVYKQQRLAETEAPPLTGPLTVMGTPQLNALSAYGEMWLWLAGDDQMLPAPGLELPNRTEGRYTRAFEDGLMRGVPRRIRQRRPREHADRRSPIRRARRPVSSRERRASTTGAATSRASRSTTCSTCGAAPRRPSRRCARRARSSTRCCFASPARSDIQARDEVAAARRVLLRALRAPGEEDGRRVPRVPGDGRAARQHGDGAPSGSSRSSTSATRSRTPSSRRCTRPSSPPSTATTSTG